jgi:hypothetical protein
MAKTELYQVEGVYSRTGQGSDEEIGVAVYSWVRDADDDLPNEFKLPLYKESGESARWMPIRELWRKVWRLSQLCLLTLQDMKLVHAMHNYHNTMPSDTRRRLNGWVRHNPTFRDGAPRQAPNVVVPGSHN